MRKNFKLSLGSLSIATVMMVSPLIAFANPSSASTISASTSKVTANYNIAYNKISFEEISAEKIPTALTNKIEQYKKDKGFIYMADDKSGVIYIAVLGGEKNNGGYSIKVTSIEDIEGKTKVTVHEEAPTKDQIVTQAIAYPFTVIKAGGITPNITVVNDLGAEYKDLSESQSEVPILVGVGEKIGTLKSIQYVDKMVYTTTKDENGKLISSDKIQEKNVYITIKGEDGELVSYYTFKGSDAEKSLKKFKRGQKVLVKFVLGTPVNNAFPFSLVTGVPKA